MKLSDIISNIVNQSAMAGWGFIASLLLLTACERRELYVYGGYVWVMLKSSSTHVALIKKS